MVAFRYQAIDAEGATKTGILNADSARLARAQLREQGLFVQHLNMANGNEATNRNILPWRRRLPSSDLALFTRQFSTLLAAGLNVDASLAAALEQAEQPLLKHILSQVRADVLAGQTLTRALSAHEYAFSPLYRALVHAGEESGELSTVMLRLADHLETRGDLRQKILLAFLYPAAVTLVASLVIIGLLTYVVPQITSVFQETHQALPLLTRLLIASSHLLRITLPYDVILLIAAGWLIRHQLKNEHNRYRWHAFLLRLPLIGSLIRDLNTARFASTLAILAGSGVPLLAALRSSALVINNLPMQEAAGQVLRRVSEGAPLSHALKSTQQFPPLLIHLTASGEASGKLAAMLERAAMQQEQSLQHRTDWLTGLLEPLLIVTMGGIVLMIVLAIMLPIIDMNQMVH